MCLVGKISSQFPLYSHFHSCSNMLITLTSKEEIIEAPTLRQLLPWLCHFIPSYELHSPARSSLIAVRI